MSWKESAKPKVEAMSTPIAAVAQLIQQRNPELETVERMHKLLEPYSREKQIVLLRTLFAYMEFNVQFEGD